LLKENALKAAFKVPTLVDQKLIKRNEVAPISSQPRRNTIKFPEQTNSIILQTNKFNKIISLLTKGSYLKYENAYATTNNAIDIVRKEKLKEILSSNKQKLTVNPGVKNIQSPKLIR
jgi:hypothetical protein